MVMPCWPAYLDQLTDEQVREICNEALCLIHNALKMGCPHTFEDHKDFPFRACLDDDWADLCKKIGYSYL